MDKSTAQRVVAETFKASFDRERFRNLRQRLPGNVGQRGIPETGDHVVNPSFLIQNNTSVRQMPGQRGIQPETPTPEEDSKKLERRVSTDAQMLGKQTGHLPRPGGSV